MIGEHAKLWDVRLLRLFEMDETDRKPWCQWRNASSNVSSVWDASFRFNVAGSELR